MKYALIFVFTIFYGVSNAQRIEKISKEDLVKHFKEDISFWQHFAAFNLSNSNLAIIKYTKIPQEEWSQTKMTRKEVSDLIRPIEQVMEFDSLGNSVGKKNVRSDFRVNFIAISDNPELKNKIGFGYQVYIKTNEQEFIVDHILFNDISNWTNLKEKRKMTFLKLFSVFPQYSKADSTINIKINNRDSKLHLFNLGATYSDSFPALNPLVDYLMKVYEKDFASVHYSGKDSSYYFKQDQFGNSKIKPVSINEYAKINEYMVEFKDENGNAARQKTLPYFTRLVAISLLFDKQAASQNLRTIYPGAYKPVITSTGIDLGNSPFFLLPSSVKRFSLTSQTLIDYLTQIYN
jgi:hypothetical protein